jgi:hypothetical protein
VNHLRLQTNALYDFFSLDGGSDLCKAVCGYLGSHQFAQ